MIDLEYIGNRIRALRLERGLTQSEFADLLCISFQAVSNWERGIASPDLDNIVRIAELFGTTVDELLRQRGEDLFLGIGFADNDKRQIGIKCIINYPKGE